MIHSDFGSYEEEKECAICYEIAFESEFTRLKCGHEAMTDCLQDYFKAMI